MTTITLKLDGVRRQTIAGQTVELNLAELTEAGIMRLIHGGSQRMISDAAALGADASAEAKVKAAKHEIDILCGRAPMPTRGATGDRDPVGKEVKRLAEFVLRKGGLSAKDARDAVRSKIGYMKAAGDGAPTWAEITAQAVANVAARAKAADGVKIDLSAI